ncbi:MAG: alpha/beta-hydrolase family protein [Candidatus Nanopelagicales bacterium]|nr:alpha/beta-hydrolase family protein [Candidatus Nanopelagicales bacterium]
MRWPKLPDSIRSFTTDPAVRVGILQATSSIAPAYSRGLLPRTPSQQAAVVGVTATAYYAVGATFWSGLSSVMAGTPGHRAGQKALLAGAAVAGVAGFVAERKLRPRSGDNLAFAAAWTTSRFMATTGLAGGLVTAGDVLLHRTVGMRPSIATTLALDIAGGTAMAAGSLARGISRAHKYGMIEPDRAAVRHLHGPKAYVTAGAISVGTVAGIAGVAVAEQTAARGIDAAFTKLARTDLGEAGIYLSHCITGAALSAAAIAALNKVRQRTQRVGDVVEPAYPSPPTSQHVSCGPRSQVDFDAIGKEGRRFVLMALAAPQISSVMDEDAINPVRVVVPPQESLEAAAQTAVNELESLGGFDKSVIVVAAPTGVGYVSYVVTEAMEYLTRGDCATVVPQYALLPSALALNRTQDGTRLQTAVLEAISARVRAMPTSRRPRIVQFGESLGAQVALDVAAGAGIPGLDALDVDSGLYLGVPFRSSTWLTWRHDPGEIDPDGRLVLAADPLLIPDAPGMHLMVVHDDDPVNKFSYSMVIKRPWWFGEPSTRPPKVPRETLFRPIVSLVIALADLMNGMNQKPGHFTRTGHDYRVDARAARQKSFNLSSTVEQADRIEQALRDREQMWAQTRLVAKTAAKAVASIQRTLNRWGESTVSLRLADGGELDLPPQITTLMQNLGRTAVGRLGSSGPAS